MSKSYLATRRNIFLRENVELSFFAADDFWFAEFHNPVVVALLELGIDGAFPAVQVSQSGVGDADDHASILVIMVVPNKLSAASKIYKCILEPQVKYLKNLFSWFAPSLSVHPQGFDPSG